MGGRLAGIWWGSALRMGLRSGRTCSSGLPRAALGVGGHPRCPEKMAERPRAGPSPLFLRSHILLQRVLGGGAKPRGGAHGGRRGRHALCPRLGGALQGWVPRAQAWRPLQRVSSRRSAEAPGGEQLTLSRCRVPGGLRAGLLPPARGSEVGAARGAPASGGRVAVTPLSFLIGHFPSSLTPPASHLSPSLSRAGLRLTHHHHRPRHRESPPAPQEHPTWPDVQGSQLRRGTGSRAPSAWA